MPSIPGGLPPSPPQSSEGEVSPEGSIDTVYPPVYGVASSGLGAAKMRSEELGDTVPPSMVSTISFSSGVYQIS